MKKRILAAFLAVVMLVSVVPVSVFADGSGTPAAQAEMGVMENTNQSDGVVMRKSVMPHTVGGVPDGTVDVIIEAYTTGVVTQSVKAIPTDIVLVLDVSGSMNNAASSTVTTVTTYDAVNGTSWRSGSFMNRQTYYGFQSEQTTYYVNTGTVEAPHYVSVRRVNPDSNNCYYYSYADGNDNAVYVYPKLRNNLNPNREYTYDVVQFYTRNETTSETVTATSLDVLKEAVDAFIESTHQKNVQIAAENPTLSGAQLEAYQHRISIVKFAGDQYAGGTPSVEEGDDFYDDSNGYEHNYSQVVKNLTVVNGSGHAELIQAMDSLRAVGATAIDSGMVLAQKVLEPANAGTAQRNKVVLVFSDGVPTHGNEFDSDVANDAIGTAKIIKETAKVYTISVAKDSDVGNTTSNLNKFFHYVSSNYPNASNLSTPGANGNAAAGYYMVPTDTSSLSTMFQAIAENIESPTIELGESAEIVDTMSTFFTIPDGTNSVSLYKSDRVKNMDGTWGWSDAYTESGLSCTVQGKTVEVHGFDYDENYVSDTPRTKNGKDYYGTALIIMINATPDYNMIDTHASMVQGGKIASNDGTANLLNTAGAAVATVESPYIQANTVSYQYTDPVTNQTVTYATYYRLAGGKQSVISATPLIPGYTFGGWSTTDASVAADGTYTMPKENIVFNGTFTANKHDVTYIITGYNPGATAPAGQTGVDFGTDVTIAADLTYPGYTFTGWQSTNPTITADQSSFTMPDRDVELIGYFTANTGIPYKTIHYIENLDGTYSVKETVNGTGTTDATVTAATRVYEGFTLDTSVTGATVTGVAGTVDTVSSGKVSADGQFTMHQFHKRNKYTVTYAYEGSAPAGAPAVPQTKEYYHGQTVTVEPHTAQDAVKDHTFAGWHTLDKTTVTDDMVSFEMPVGNITLYGHFSVKENVPFHIHHYLQNADGSYPASPNYTGTSYEVAGTTEYASEFVRTIPGYTYDPHVTGSVTQGIVSEDPVLVLKLYYTVNKYNVIYRYENAIPAGATDLAPYQMTDVAYGTVLNIGADATAPGYVFSGWVIESPMEAVIKDGKITMPASDVVLVGSFTARTNTPYRIEYYWQNVEGDGYTLHEWQNLTGTTDSTVTIPEKTYPGFTFNGSASGTKLSGTVSADGTLVLKRYYDRNTYQVKYAYEASSSSISNLPPLPEDTTAYRYGATVTVKPDVSRADYDFIGWYSKGSSAVAANTVSFTMPIPQNGQYVTLWGEFFAKSDVPFTIEHYLIGVGGTVPTVPYDVDKSHGVAGTTVQAADYVLSFTGYVFDHADPVQGVITEVAPGLVLKLYYVPNTYNVIYKYENGTLVPAGATDLTSYQMSGVPYGTSVTVGADATAPGYIFSGWRVEAPVEAVVTGGQFTMPASDVVLVGSFTARTNTPYRIEYYWQNANDNGYTLHEGQDLTGVTDATATIPVRTYAGFHLNSAVPGTLTTGTITADGNLVLRLYYDRDTYRVEYAYEATTDTISNRPALPVDTKEYRYGQTVTVAPVVSLTDYNFIGWYTKQNGTVTSAVTEFAMPIPYDGEKVTLWGDFAPMDDVQFTIEHYLQNTAGTNDYSLAVTAKSHGVTNADVTAEAYKRTFTGYTFDHADPATGKIQTGLVLKLYYNLNAHNVTYEYEGVIPVGATDLSTYQLSGVPYGTSVAVGADAEAAGYVFSGWTLVDPISTPVADGKFVMPDQNVRLVGSFEARTNNQYRVEYYWQNTTDNGFTLYETDTYHNGVTGATVYALEKSYPGLMLDTNITGTVESGIVKPDGQLVLKLYYIRDTYTVEYKYESAISGAPALPTTKAYRFGQTVTVADDAVLTNYDFVGWHTKAGSAVTVTATAASFTMPAANVTLYGEFFAKKNVPFTVEHYLETENGYKLEITDTFAGMAGAVVKADDYKRPFAGHTYDPAVAGSVTQGAISEAPALVLKLYYTLNKHNVTYEYINFVPSNANPAEATLGTLTQYNVPYGTKVNVAAPATADGYVFSGWQLKERSTFIDGNGQFVMPDKDVVLVGSFEARTNNQYKVEYYWQNTEGDGFTLYETDTYNNGVTGSTVTAPVKTYTGLTLDKSVSGTVESGTVVASSDPDYPLTLKLYYVRDTYTVEYKYESDVAGAPALPTTQTYRYGQSVTVAEDAVLEHYDFHGWYTKTSAFAVNAGMASFTMPAENLTLWGEFKRIEGVHYKVEHYLLDANGNPAATPILTEEFEDGIAGEIVTGTPKKASVDNRFTGYVHDPAAAGSVLSGEVVASSDPNYPLTLKLYYKRATYRVIYEYVGTLPANRSPLPAAADAVYMSEVTVAANATADGYTFSGWTIQSPAGVTVNGGKFEMPAQDVILVGFFDINPPYEVEYWLQTTDHQSYVKDENASHTHTAPIGETVEAHHREFEGYTENTTHPDRVPTGVVPATGTLTLKLFYDRIDYTVTYVFETPVPAGAVLPAPATKHFGDNVTTPAPTLEGYTFSGWTSDEVGSVTAGQNFTMPAKNVTLKGKFIAGNAAYTVEHYLMNDNGNYDNVTPYTETKSGVVGDSVRAVAYQGYLAMGAKLDGDKIYAVNQWEGVVSATTPLVLKLYYSREASYKVVYHYVDDLTEDQWRALGWPDLPTDTKMYYTGATVTALDVIGTKPDKHVFEGWFSSDPTILVAPGGTFTMPALTSSDKTIHLYGKWVSSQPQEFTVRYFVDGIEQTHLTQIYPLNTVVTVLDKLENTSSHSYGSWSTPVSVTEGVNVVLNPDGTFTMKEHGEVHIRCTSTPIAPVAIYTVRYYLDGQLYWEGGYQAFQRHFMLDAPILPAGYYFSGWSVPRTPQGLTLNVLYNGLGQAVFTMLASDVVIYGTTGRTPIPDGTMKIEKVLKAPAGFTGSQEFTFRIYQVVGGTKTLVRTETVKVNSKTGEGSSSYFDLPQGNNYLVEEVGAGVPGYALTTVVTDANNNVIPYGSMVTVKPRVTPTVLTFTNTYTDLSLETRDHFGYIIGYHDDTVRPEANITRAEVATIFFRLLTDAKRAEYWSKSNSFSDVREEHWYNNAISTLAKAGALSGYEDGTFRPDQPITRAELVKIAMSFYGTVHSDSDMFNDVGEHWAAAFINGAADLGFVNGYGDETFQPDRYVTRAEAIKIINRTLNRAPDKDHLLPNMITWVDNMDTEAWYYAEIQEATNSHTYTWDKTSEIWEQIRPVRDWSKLEKAWSEANDGE